MLHQAGQGSQTDPDSTVPKNCAKTLAEHASKWLLDHGLPPLAATHFGHELALAAEKLTPAASWPDEREWPGPVGVLARVVGGIVVVNAWALAILDGRDEA